MPTFVKKPIPIEAHRWHKNGDHPDDGPADAEGAVVRYFRDPTRDGRLICQHCSVALFSHGWIDTLEGGHIVCPGDFVITGVKGERYPCKPDIFLETYSPGDADAAAMYATTLVELGQALAFCGRCLEIIEGNPREHAVDLKHPVAMVLRDPVKDPPNLEPGTYYRSFSENPATGEPLAYFGPLEDRGAMEKRLLS